MQAELGLIWMCMKGYDYHEEWREIAGTGGLYEVSNRGRIRSLKFGKILIMEGWIQSIGKYQRRFVTLRYSGIRKVVTVHRLVAGAFLDPEDGRAEVNHIDGDPLNNDISNLEYVTHAENMDHAVRIGLIQNNAAKNKHIVEKMYSEGYSKRRIAKAVGASWLSVKKLLEKERMI